MWRKKIPAKGDVERGAPIENTKELARKEEEEVEPEPKAEPTPRVGTAPQVAEPAKVMPKPPASSGQLAWQLGEFVHVDSLLSGFCLEVGPPGAGKTRRVGLAKKIEGEPRQLWRINEATGHFECADGGVVLAVSGKAVAKAVVCAEAPATEGSHPGQRWRLSSEGELLFEM